MTRTRITKETICLRCIAKAGLASDRCERCEDYSAIECGPYSLSDLANLSGQGKLAFILSELAALEGKANED
jgi:ribosomal protein L40E